MSDDLRPFKKRIEAELRPILKKRARVEDPGAMIDPLGRLEVGPRELGVEVMRSFGEDVGADEIESRARVAGRLLVLWMRGDETVVMGVRVDAYGRLQPKEAPNVR